MQNDSLNVQYRINPATVLEVCYVGSLSRHLPATLDINQIPLGSTSNTARPSYNQFPNLAAINEVQSVANACYNAAIISLRSSNYHGFTMKFNYTYSHSRDDLSSTRGVIPQNSCNLRDDYGNSDFDVRHSFSGLVGYNVPSPSRYNCCSRNCNWTRC